MMITFTQKWKDCALVFYVTFDKQMVDNILAWFLYSIKISNKIIYGDALIISKYIHTLFNIDHIHFSNKNYKK